MGKQCWDLGNTIRTFAFIALCITAWCALRASTYSSSLLKGVFASDIGLTRCARQYSATRVMILPQCSSLVFVQRVQRPRRGRAEFVDLHHGFADGGARFFDVRHARGVVENTTRHLAVPASQTQHQVQGGFLLDVVIRTACGRPPAACPRR